MPYLTTCVLFWELSRRRDQSSVPRCKRSWLCHLTLNQITHTVTFFYGFSTVGEKFAAKVRNSTQCGANAECPNRLASARLTDDAGRTRGRDALWRARCGVYDPRKLRVQTAR